MIKFTDYPNFQPDLPPAAILYLGAFGGTYFRPIYSQVTKRYYSDVHLQYKNIKDMTSVVTRPFDKYNTTINLFKVKCGATLEYWEIKNWIKPQDPYGWFQWYIEFYEGRRTQDDGRQISRWIRRKKLYIKTNKSPIIRQVWLHWGIL